MSPTPSAYTAPPPLPHSRTPGHSQPNPGRYPGCPFCVPITAQQSSSLPLPRGSPLSHDLQRLTRTQLSLSKKRGELSGMNSSSPSPHPTERLVSHMPSLPLPLPEGEGGPPPSKPICTSCAWDASAHLRHVAFQIFPPFPRSSIPPFLLASSLK